MISDKRIASFSIKLVMSISIASGISPAKQAISISEIALAKTPPSVLTPSHSSSPLNLKGTTTFSFVFLDTL